MKSNQINSRNILSIVFFLLLTAFSLSQYSCKSGSASEDNAAMKMDVNGIPDLAEREGALAQTEEWQNVKLKVAELKEKIGNNLADLKPRLQLATIYMSEARITANPYYYDATWRILDGVLKIDPNNFESYVFKASVAMSLHNFSEAKQLAEKAKSINPDNAYVYGILVDANVELGNYKEAIAMSDKMQSIKPSLEAYSRVSYLREIYGDYPGAIEAMKLAVQAGAPGLESTEWARVTLGDLYVNTGNLTEAKIQYETALQNRKEFPNAEMGLAKIDKANKNYDGAINHTKNAIRLVSESGFVSFLGDLYELKGDAKQAEETRNEVVDLLEQAEKDQPKNALIKHNPNRELANAYLADKQLDKALQYAQNDLKIRPDNIDANELVAWICYLKGDYAGAKMHADKMLVTNSKNANTLYKAGMIYSKSGDMAKGESLKQAASNVNPNIDQRIILAAR
jgi:tetratricopeptide (TPR) repeat protein